MKKLFLMLLFILSSLNPSFSEVKKNENFVTIIPIQGAIEPGLLYVVRRGLDNAVRNKSKAIIFQLDTPGGTVNSAGEIINLIGKINIPSYTYVDNSAYSAGAFIALSTKKIFMSPGSVIGAATPMMMSPMGGVQEMPDDVKEKMTSAVSAMVRAAAEQGGHDPELAECMVRANLEYKFGRKIISKKGELLTMTNTEAEQKNSKGKLLLSSGTVDNIDDLITQLNIENPNKNIITVTGAEKFGRAIASIAPILMMIGMGGIWLEFKTPGIGIFGLIGGSCLLLFFFGHHIAGLSGFEDFIFFIIGMVLIILEIFITPGFGLLGISGLIIMLFSLINAMVERIPGSWKPISLEPSIFIDPLINVSIAFFGSLCLVIFLGRFLPSSSFISNIFLNEKITNYSIKNDITGEIGTTLSDLRPSGSVMINDEKIDVFTNGEFIEKNSKVEIMSSDGVRTIVRKV